MIIKNEEKHLHEFLTHIHDAVDEIIVVDTGSTDTSKAIAASFSKVKLFDFVWCNDFAKARNESLKHASGDWILVLDADERLSKKDQAQLKKITSKKRYSGFTLVQRNYSNDPQHRYFIHKGTDPYTEAQPYLGWTEHHVVRFFRNKPEYFYCFKVHELIEPSIQAAQGTIGDSKIPIHHYGQVAEEDITRKFALYATINEEKCKETPDDERAWFEQGINELKLKHYEEAAHCFEQVYELDPDHPLVCGYLVDVYGKLKDATGVIRSFQRGVQSNPLDIHLYLNIGAIFLVNQKYTESAKAYAQATEIDRKNSVAWFGLGASYYHLSEWKKSAKALRNVLKLHPRHPKAQELLKNIPS